MVQLKKKKKLHLFFYYSELSDKDYDGNVTDVYM